METHTLVVIKNILEATYRFRIVYLIRLSTWGRPQLLLYSEKKIEWFVGWYLAFYGPHIKSCYDVVHSATHLVQNKIQLKKKYYFDANCFSPFKFNNPLPQSAHGFIDKLNLTFTWDISPKSNPSLHIYRVGNRN